MRARVFYTTAYQHTILRQTYRARCAWVGDKFMYTHTHTTLTHAQLDVSTHTFRAKLHATIQTTYARLMCVVRAWCVRTQTGMCVVIPTATATAAVQVECARTRILHVLSTYCMPVANAVRARICTEYTAYVRTD